MKVFVCLALCAFGLTSAKVMIPRSASQQSFTDEEQGYFSSAMSWLSGSMGIGGSEEDLLNVCESQTSRTTNKKVQRTLESSVDILSQLEQAMDQDDKEQLMDIIKNGKKILPKEVAAIQGTVFAAVQSKTGNFRGEQKRCAGRVVGELQMLIKQLKSVQQQTNEAASDLKQQSNNGQFLQIMETLKGLMTQAEQFVKEPNQKDRLQKPCQSAHLPRMMKQIVETLKQMKKQLQQADEEEKINAVESAAGLLAEANILNAICHGVENVDKSDNVQKQLMKKDAQLIQKQVNELESTSKAILGRSGFFKRMLGY